MDLKRTMLKYNYLSDFLLKSFYNQDFVD